MTSRVFRITFYLICALAFVFFTEKHKQTITKRLSATPLSVLDLHIKNGVPVQTYLVEKRKLTEKIRVSVHRCKQAYCFDLPNNQARQISEQAKLTRPSMKDPVGKVLSRSRVNPLTGLSRFSVQITDDAIKAELLKKPFTVLSVEGQTLGPVLAVPTESLVYGAEDPYLWLFNDGQPQQTTVEVGLQTDGWVEIRKGIKERDRIVVVGQGLLNQFAKARELDPNQSGNVGDK